MNINRHNYESFFLLYVDNELSVSERNALELFVKDNADLQKELDMLKQSIVKADTIIFKGKNNLLKPEKISAEREEQLLLYIDNELSTTQSKELELVLFDDNSMATELQILQQAKLLPDNSIVFTDKKSLYRKEPNRVIAFGWWRLAAAAVFIGFIIWGTALYFNSGSKVVGNQTATAKGVKSTTVVKDLPATTIPADKTPGAEIAAAVTPQQIPNETVSQKLIEPSVQGKQKTPALQQNNDVVNLQKINTEPSNNLPKPYFENKNAAGSNKNDPGNATPQMQGITTNNIAVTEKDNKDQTAESDKSIYATAFSDNSNENKEDAFKFSDEEPKKSKLSGLLRKAKRVLERNTKMKTGDNTLKVANLEFAIQ